MTRKDKEREAEVRRRWRDRQTEKCQTEVGGQRGGDSERGLVGGNTKLKEAERGEGGWRRKMEMGKKERKERRNQGRRVGVTG